MKRLITISIILISILVCCVLGITHISSTNHQMYQYLDQSIEALQSEQFQDAHSRVEDAQKLWKSSGEMIDRYVNHYMVDTVEENLVRLNALIESKQTQQALVVIETIQFELNHIYECELPSLKNIF